MATVATKSNADQQTASVGMAQIGVFTEPTTASTVLGSCIGLVLFERRLKVAAMAHIVLPDSKGRQGAAGKFADTALPKMLELLSQLGIHRASLVAKLAGGANMFGGAGPIRVGEANLEAVEQLLAQLKIPVAGRDVGGTKGRRMTLESQSGKIVVERAGEEAVVL